MHQAGLRLDHDDLGRVKLLAGIVDRFHLTSLQPSLEACQALAQTDALLDVAVLGQFKSGKSTLLNTLLGEPLFPVSVLPATAVITRALAGEQQVSRVHYVDGREEDIPLQDLHLYVTEAGNPHNQRQVAIVDVITPRMQRWPGIRLVDTPGLGSLFAHNTEATRAWMPNIAIALVAVSVERPLSEEDRRLIDEARRLAPRVVVVLTKVDLLTEAELQEVTTFVHHSLQLSHEASIPVMHFSARVEPMRWVTELRETVLDPVSHNLADERKAALTLKLSHLTQACRGYLSIGLHAAEQADADRDKLRAAVMDESVKVDVIRDELRLAAARIVESIRPTLEKAFSDHRASITKHVSDALAQDIKGWKGHLAQQTHHYQQWIDERLQHELTPVSASGASLAHDRLKEAEVRMRRVIEAFRDRLGHNMVKATGLSIPPAVWEVNLPRITTVSVSINQTFMTHWDLLWWLLPMWLVGGIFRRHVLGLIPWEVEKNLVRLASDWTVATEVAIADLRLQAEYWVSREVTTLSSMLEQRTGEAMRFREALTELGSVKHESSE